MEELKCKVKDVEKINDGLKHDYEEAVNDSERCYKRISDLESQVERLRDTLEKVSGEDKKKDLLLKELNQKKDDLENAVDVAEKSWKKSNKALKEKEKEINELKKENIEVTDNLAEVKSEYVKLTAKFNKEVKIEKRILRSK